MCVSIQRNCNSSLQPPPAQNNDKGRRRRTEYNYTHYFFFLGQIDQENTAEIQKRRLFMKNMKFFPVYQVLFKVTTTGYACLKNIFFFLGGGGIKLSSRKRTAELLIFFGLHFDNCLHTT